jgi:hypothetical protein
MSGDYIAGMRFTASRPLGLRFAEVIPLRFPEVLLGVFSLLPI